jgi:hypothetical protein
VRKSYIVQYAPDGAVHRTRDQPATLQNDHERQYLVLSDGLSINVG